MSREATILSSLRIAKGKLVYQSNPTAFYVDVTTAKGPVPGAIAATVAGVDVDLSGLTTPSLCRLMNLDDTNFVTVGAYEPTGSSFIPFMEIGPGETYVIKLSQSFGQQWAGTGTADEAGVVSLHIKADTDACVVLVEAFEL